MRIQVEDRSFLFSVRESNPRPLLRCHSLRYLIVGVLLGFLAPVTTLGTISEKQPSSRILQVGPDKLYVKPSEAARAARDGDVVEIDAGTYYGDVAVWQQNNVTIRGVGGVAHLKADGAHAEEKAIWVMKGRNTTIENIEFSGATVADHNGAGIRQEGPGLTVRHCYFHDNETSILAGNNLESDIVIEHSEFANNSYPNGLAHNMYMGRLRSFILRFSYVHHAKIGHNVKSRALENFILYNRIMDEEDGSSSYVINLPNGGSSYLIGNLIQQGPKAENWTMVSYGEEGLNNPGDLYVVNNTFVNDLHAGTFIRVAPGAAPAKLVNNLFTGLGTVLNGEGVQITNLVTNVPGLVDLDKFDYRLRPSSPAVDQGSEPGLANGYDLMPKFHYLHKAERETRTSAGIIDIGAYEFAGSGTGRAVLSPGDLVGEPELLTALIVIGIGAAMSSLFGLSRLCYRRRRLRHESRMRSVRGARPEVSGRHGL